MSFKTPAQNRLGNRTAPLILAGSKDGAVSGPPGRTPIPTMRSTSSKKSTGSSGSSGSSSSKTRSFSSSSSSSSKGSRTPANDRLDRIRISNFVNNSIIEEEVHTPSKDETPQISVRATTSTPMTNFGNGGGVNPMIRDNLASKVRQNLRITLDGIARATDDGSNSECKENSPEGGEGGMWRRKVQKFAGRTPTSKQLQFQMSGGGAIRRRVMIDDDDQDMFELSQGSRGEMPNDNGESNDGAVGRTPVTNREGEIILNPSMPCICNRALKRVICRMCGFFMEGRVQRFCRRHPKDLYLLDVSTCPGCGVIANRNLIEHDLPENHKPKQKNVRVYN